MFTITITITMIHWYMRSQESELVPVSDVSHKPGGGCQARGQPPSSRVSSPFAPSTEVFCLLTEARGCK